MPFNFAQVETALASAHMIVDSKRSAFANRLKHLQKLDFLPETNTGRGKAAVYFGQHAFLLAMALEFIELGLTPERTKRVIHENQQFILPPARWALKTLNEKPDSPDAFFVRFDPATLNALRDDGENFDEACDSLFYAGVGTLNEFLKEESNSIISRLALINVTATIMHAFAGFYQQSPQLADDFEHELEAWLEKFPDDADGNP